jgi:lysozyme
MTVNRKVIDLSHWDTVTSWSDIKAAGIIGVIHKATEYTTYVDPDYHSRKTAAQAAGLLWGAYHFAHTGNVVEQLANFLNTTGIDKTMLYALDWEDSPSGTMTAAEAQQFITLLEGQLGALNLAVVYSGNTLKDRLGSAVNPFFGARRLWLADWNSTPVCQSSWASPWLWQYGDGVTGPAPLNCPGVADACDTSSWAGTDDALIAQWAGTPPPLPPPPPATPVVNITTTGGVLVIVNGVTLS